MIGAAQDWLEARVPFDDTARQQSLPLLDRAAQALLDADPSGQSRLTIVDLGAGTGKSAAWFREHLTPRLPGRTIQWLLVDAHEPSLEIATQHVGEADTIVTRLSELPTALGEYLPGHPAPGSLFLTCSAVLDVLTQDDVDAILTTLDTYKGLGLFLLSITADWHLTPPDPGMSGWPRPSPPISDGTASWVRTAATSCCVPHENVGSLQPTATLPGS